MQDLRNGLWGLREGGDDLEFLLVGCGHENVQPFASMSAGTVGSGSFGARRRWRAYASAAAVRRAGPAPWARAVFTSARAAASSVLRRAPSGPSKQRQSRAMMGGALPPITSA